MMNKPDLAALSEALEGVEDIRFLNEGGFKAVYEASIAGSREALKVIFVPEEESMPDDRDEIILRTKREIESLRQLESRFIVKLGSLTPFQCQIQSHEYIVYSEELLTGSSLRSQIRSSPRPTLASCISLFACLLDVIAELKSKELIHRDIKPDNIISLDNNERPFVILDFGIAFKLHSTAITRNPDMRQGTLPYMAPEMFDPNFRELMDYRSDLYSAGVTIYEYATQVHPIARRGDDDLTTMHRIVDMKPVRLSIIRDDFPAEFCGIIDQLIRKKPILRPSNLTELRALIERLR